MVKLQEESERNYMKLEEKTLEMEERRQKDNQEFMMRMFSFMCNQPSNATTTTKHSTATLQLSPNVQFLLTL